MRELPLTTKGTALIDDEDFKHVGHLSWDVCADGRVARRVEGIKGRELLYLHDWVLQTDGSVGVVHLDGNKLNNQRLNLDVPAWHQATVAQDPPARVTRGKVMPPRVYETDVGHYRATVRLQGVTYYAGTYPTVEEAVAAQKKALETGKLPPRKRRGRLPDSSAADFAEKAAKVAVKPTLEGWMGSVHRTQKDSAPKAAPASLDAAVEAIWSRTDRDFGEGQRQSLLCVSLTAARMLAEAHA